MTLARAITSALLEHGPMATCDIATAVHRRKADVGAELESNAAFVHNGQRARASRWGLRSFDAALLIELHPDWDETWAREVIRWLIDGGFAASVNGNGSAVVTAAGQKLSRDLSLCGVE